MSFSVGFDSAMEVFGVSAEAGSALNAGHELGSNGPARICAGSRGRGGRRGNDGHWRGFDGGVGQFGAGRHTGNGNGGRDHFRFKRTGADYPDGLLVQATLTTGDTVRYRIGETSQRTENIDPAIDKDGSGAEDSDTSGPGGTTTRGSNSSPDDAPDAL